jgi:hypothetical protein
MGWQMPPLVHIAAPPILSELIDLDLDGWGPSNSPDDLNNHPYLARQLSVF